MSYDYKGKVAVITGASAGIGETTAIELAGRGMKTVLAARRADKLAAVQAKVEAKGAEALSVVTDVTDEQANQHLIDQAVERFGTVDVLVLNAGRGNTTSIEDTTPEILKSMFELNVFALYYATRAALPIMKKQGSGRIITISSMAGKLGLPYMNAYAAAKHAAVGFSNVLRLELVETGIEATVICPAGVATEWAGVTEGSSMMDLFMGSFERAKEIAKERDIRGRRSPMLTAQDLADAVVSAIENPVPEIYTHEGSHESFIDSAKNRADAERTATPMALAMRETYERLAKK